MEGTQSGRYEVVLLNYDPWFATLHNKFYSGIYLFAICDACVHVNNMHACVCVVFMSVYVCVCVSQCPCSVCVCEAIHYVVNNDKHNTDGQLCVQYRPTTGNMSWNFFFFLDTTFGSVSKWRYGQPSKCSVWQQISNDFFLDSKMFPGLIETDLQYIVLSNVRLCFKYWKNRITTFWNSL